MSDLVNTQPPRSNPDRGPYGNGWSIATYLGHTPAVPVDGSLPIWDRDKFPIKARASPLFLTALGDPQFRATGIPGVQAGGPVNAVWLSRAADAGAPDHRGPLHRGRSGASGG